MASSFPTDSGISGFTEASGEKELVPWDVPEGNDEIIELDTSSSGWDVKEMFKKNEEVYGIVSDFDIKLSGYTMPLCDEDTESYKVAKAKATEIIKGRGTGQISQACKNTEQDKLNTGKKCETTMPSPSTGSSPNKKGKSLDSVHHKRQLEKTKELDSQSSDSASNGSNKSSSVVPHCPSLNEAKEKEPMSHNHKNAHAGSRRQKSGKNRAKFNDNQNKQRKSASNDKRSTNEHTEAFSRNHCAQTRPSLLTALLTEYHSASEVNKSKQPVPERRFHAVGNAEAICNSAQARDVLPNQQKPQDARTSADSSQLNAATSDLPTQATAECKSPVSALNPNAKPFVSKSHSFSNYSDSSANETSPQTMKFDNASRPYTPPEKPNEFSTVSFSPSDIYSQPASGANTVFPRQLFMQPVSPPPPYMPPLCQPVDPNYYISIANRLPVLGSCFPSPTSPSSDQPPLSFTGLGGGNICSLMPAYRFYTPQGQFPSQNYPTSFSSTSETPGVVVALQRNASELPSGSVRQGVASNSNVPTYRLIDARPVNIYSPHGYHSPTHFQG